MQAEHEQIAAGEASWPRASLGPCWRRQEWARLLGCGGWSDKLEGLQFLEDHTQFHLLSVLLSITLRPLQEQSTGARGSVGTGTHLQPFKLHSGMCSVYGVQPLLRCPGGDPTTSDVYGTSYHRACSVSLPPEAGAQGLVQI